MGKQRRKEKDSRKKNEGRNEISEIYIKKRKEIRKEGRKEGGRETGGREGEKGRRKKEGNIKRKKIKYVRNDKEMIKAKM